jgi:hypothetical protein
MGRPLLAKDLDRIVNQENHKSPILDFGGIFRSIFQPSIITIAVGKFHEKLG